MIAPRDTGKWAQSVAESTGLKLTTLGRSAQGRRIIALGSDGRQPETVVITGRQHPPELTGALALRYFVERLTSGDDLSRRFRHRFGLLVVPMMNPDGVAEGLWRHDTAGTDLNRDWGPFQRPETRLMRDALEAPVNAGAPPALLVDFHSTWRDVLYTQPDDAPGTRAELPGTWHQAINDRLDEPDIQRSDDRNPGRPTLKTWAHETFQIPGITFEIGDETAEARIRTLAVIAAEELMTLLLGHHV